jgi:hypothetical protein
MSDDWTPGAGSRTLTPEAGMLVAWNGTSMRLIGEPAREACGRGCTSWWAVRAPGNRSSAWVPDLADPATRYLALAQLARRVGLDPAWGVTWEQDDSDAGQWHLHTPTGGRTYHPRHASERSTHVPGIDTDDPAEALDRALWATRGQP